MTVGLIGLSFFLSVAGVWTFHRFAAGNARLLDVPNDRSSHSTPVTRGAGIAILLAVIGIYIGVYRTEINPAYILASVMIAIVSFLDDLYSISLLIRLAVHFAAAALFVCFSGAYVEISGLWPSFGFGPLGPVISILFIVWTINAFNFMDGIDGIAGAQGVGVGIGWMLVGIVTGITVYSFMGAILCGACAGFLVFNWQPAKVFMGDVGSTFLGFTVSVFPLIDAKNEKASEPWVFVATIVFLWLFLFDTLFTRIRQIISMKPFWRPHRDHLYQQIVAGGRSHQAVAGYFGSVAIAIAFAFAFAEKISVFPLVMLLLLSPILLMFWAGKKRLT